jgi:hypothetical protein
MATPRKKKQTLAEFRAWLSGIEELQPENWAPDATQWKLIRDKIHSIIEPKASTADAEMLQKLIESMGNNAPAAQQGNPYAQQATAHIPPPPPPVGGVPAGPVEATPAAAAALPPAQAVDITEVAKPNLDTSDGNYSSSFT